MSSYIPAALQSATFANFRVTIKQLVLSAADSRVHLEPAKKSETAEIYWVTFHFVDYGFTGSKGFTKFFIYIVSNFELKMWKFLSTVRSYNW